MGAITALNTPVQLQSVTALLTSSFGKKDKCCFQGLPKTSTCLKALCKNEKDDVFSPERHIFFKSILMQQHKRPWTTCYFSQLTASTSCLFVSVFCLITLLSSYALCLSSCHSFPSSHLSLPGNTPVGHLLALFFSAAFHFLFFPS